MALATHSLDSVIGNSKRPTEEVLADLAASDEFAAVVKQAVEKSHELEPGVMGPAFSQQVRVAIGQSLVGNGQN